MSLPSCGVREVTDGWLCGVDVVSECLRGSSLSVYSRFSFAGSGAPRLMSSSLSSVQQAFPQTMASCVRKGKGSGGCKQLPCHTMLHRVHSVSVQPASQAWHWSFLSPSQCGLRAFVRQSRATMCPVGGWVVCLCLLGGGVCTCVICVRVGVLTCVRDRFAGPPVRGRGGRRGERGEA